MRVQKIPEAGMAGGSSPKWWRPIFTSRIIGGGSIIMMTPMSPSSVLLITPIVVVPNARRIADGRKKRTGFEKLAKPTIGCFVMTGLEPLSG
jgi:hypothetical protein